MKFNILIDGHAGQGPNTLAKVVGKVLTRLGYYVFVSREYGSYIRGGHNANLLTVSDEPVMSNPSWIDVAVFLEQKKELRHPGVIKKSCITMNSNGEHNMHYAGRLIKLFGLDFSLLESELRNLKNFEENLREAREGYERGKVMIPLDSLKNKLDFIDGGEGVAIGAVASGLDVYLGYPMTPATSVMSELAERQFDNNFFVFEMEGEIAVINAAIGAAITGAKAMTGSSGGGFDLMTEALSLAGQAEVPLVIYLAQRVGPATGAATYTSQSDLNLALNSGHGEFNRIVLAPGEPLECQELTSQAFYFSQKYKIPALVLSDKHLAESIYSLSGKPKVTKSEKSVKLGRFSSYEHDKDGNVTDRPELLVQNAEKRIKKAAEIAKEARKFETFKVYGRKSSKNLVIFWGSTKGAVLDACKELDVKALQVLYMEPFPDGVKEELKKAKKVLIVENNSTAQLASLISSKTCFHFDARDKILKYDGRPFFSDKLKEEIERRIK
jgi:2-oxoglutarate ferredoxin oxidoreductase subunit alpha